MDLPIIQENKDLQQAVSARELHKSLESTERFSSWFARQLQYGFDEGIDFIGCKAFNTLANQELQDYFISIDMAKEVAMIQRTKVGKRVRQYFIDCEKKATASTPAIPQTFAEALQLAADQARQLELAKPKIQHYDTVVERNTLLNATQVAQKLGLTAQKLNKVLDMLNVYDKRVRRCRAFTSWFVQDGLGEMKQTFTGHSQALFTTKGEAWVIEQLSEGV